MTSLSVIFVSIDSGSSKPFWVLEWGQEARGAPSSARVWGRRAAEFRQNPGYHERRRQGRGMLLDLSRAAAAAFAGMDPSQPFPDDTHEDDMVGPQLVPKMQKNDSRTVEISKMQPWSEREGDAR